VKINQRYSDKLKVQKHKNKEAVDDYTDTTSSKPCVMHASGRVFLFSASPVSLKAELKHERERNRPYQFRTTLHKA